MYRASSSRYGSFSYEDRLIATLKDVTFAVVGAIERLAVPAV